MLLIQMLGYYRSRKNAVSLHERAVLWAVMNGTSSGYPTICNMCPQEKQGQWNRSTKLALVVVVKRWIQSSSDLGALSAARPGMLGGDKEGKEEAGLQ